MSLRERVVSALCCVLMERSGVFSPFRQFKPIAVPDRSFFQQVQTLCVHTMTGPSLAACNIGRDLHFRLDRYRDAALLYHWSEDLPLNCCNCSALTVHKDSSGFECNLFHQRHSRRFCLKTCSCRLTMEPWQGECQGLRYVHDRREKCATPKPIFFTCPNISRH